MLQLKNIKFSEWNSEETNCFQAVVYLNGKRVGVAYNEGHGGPTDVHPIGDDFEGYRNLRDYCKALADANKEEYYDTFSAIDLLFEEWLEKRDAKQHEAKMKKEFSKGICYSNGEPNAYRILTFKIGGKATTITEIQGSLSGRAFLIEKCKGLEAQGCKVLNTNLSFTF